METTPHSPRDMVHGPGFALGLRGLDFQLVVRPPRPGELLARKADILAAIDDFPVGACSPAAILEALQRHDGVEVTIGAVPLPAAARDWEVQVSPSRLAAYLVPREGDSGEDVPVTHEGVMAALAALGVTDGILPGPIASMVTGGLTRIIAVARGKAPGASQSAHIEFTFQQDFHHAPVQRSDGSIDFHAGGAQMGVAEGAVLARRLPPIQGEPGIDIFGNILPATRADDKALGIYAGKGTEVQGDLIIAMRCGRAAMAGTKIEVLQVLEIKGDVNYAVGNISFNGDIIIGGDVQPGFTVEAQGSITVKGFVDRAVITAGRDIVAAGIVGDGHTRITAGGDMKAQYLHHVHVTVKGALTINREIVGCVVTATTVQTSPNGRIVGGEVTAADEISAGTLGSPQAVPTALAVLSGDAKHTAVIRGTHAVHAATSIRVRHSALQVLDDLAGASFWEFEGEVSRLGAAASAPQPKPGNGHALVA